MGRLTRNLVHPELPNRYLLALKVSAEPALRPLVICVKAFLRQKGLSELYSGGLSSYAVFNLVLAHLQAEGATSKDDSRWRLPSASPGGEQSDKRTCLGFLLWSFFHRFGFTFDYREQVGRLSSKSPVVTSSLLCPHHGQGHSVAHSFVCVWQAISIQKQGITEKQLRWRKPSSPWLLAIEDPQVELPNVSIGIRLIVVVFFHARNRDKHNELYCGPAGSLGSGRPANEDAVLDIAFAFC